MEDDYRQLDQIQHIHHRPDMYVGTTRPQKEKNVWVVDIESGKIIQKESVRYSPGLERIFVEAVSNAIDNVWRSKKSDTPSTKIKINIDKKTGITSVWNDGKSIPIKINKQTGLYNPTMIFGHLLTSSNYDDKKKRMTSGRNGIGVKLTNVFSKEFKIKVSDSTTNQVFKQKWSENMRKESEHKITEHEEVENFTEVTWIPDFEKFKCKVYSKDMLSIYYKYVYDCAMVTGIPVYLNGKRIPIKSLEDYAKIYLKEPTKEIIRFKTKKSEVVLTPSQTGRFEMIPFTNGVFNKDGGVHVDEWAEAIFRPLVNKFNKPKKPHINIKDIKQHFRIFINCKLVNPEFASQSKTKLTAPTVKTRVPKTSISKLLKWSFSENIKDLIKGKELVNLKKISKRSKSFKKIQGFDPANNAGGKKSSECTLILCEGLSAKTYAVQGIQVGYRGKKGRDWFGIYPLRGKVMNVRNAKTESITKNKEISDVINALGVQFGVDYRDDNNFQTLNYGKVMIICDSDVDGIHISSLIINFFHKLFPTLLGRDEPFIESMQTPIVKVFMNKKEHTFYNNLKFLKFAEENKDNKYKVKYYKGLGTSSNKEVKATFGQKVIDYVKDEKTDENMDKIFSSKESNKRKRWLENYNSKDIFEIENNEMTISDFLDKELIKFSIDDCGRSIPNLFDGLKQSHRKILYSVFKKNLTFKGSSMKVAQLAGYVAEQSNYHHGEQCLFDTITKMAHNFPGSNNIEYLFPDGQFGSRLLGGKDAANARYIFTKQAKNTRLIFPKEDDDLLKKIEDDGDIVEPHFYLPIIPMVLVNGCNAGIGTGWSCSIPQYNPIELIDSIQKWLNSEELPELTPWYKGFNGVIQKVTDNKYMTVGKFSQDKNKYIIDELPINMWTDKYKEFLEDLLEKKKIKSLKNYSTPTKIKFVIVPQNGFKCNLDSLKLKTYLSTNNMVLFTTGNKLRKFDTVNEIIEIFCSKRLKLYKKRKKRLLKTLKENLKWCKNEKRFIEDVINGYLVIYRKEIEDIEKEMESKSYDKKDENYDYLLNKPISTMTKNKIKLLDKKIEKIEEDIGIIDEKTEKMMWIEELKRLIEII